MNDNNYPQNAISPIDSSLHGGQSSKGLAGLQRYTTEVLNNSLQWGFDKSQLSIKRHKLDSNTWQLTVINTKTQKIILQAEGHGDTIFAQEHNLARMAETLMRQDLVIRTQFEK